MCCKVMCAVGPFHFQEVSVAMIRRGDYYYHALMYRPCMELWKYTFRVRLATLHPLSRELEYTSYKVLLQLQIQWNVIIKLKH